MSNYKIKGTGLDDYFNTGNSVINSGAYVGFPNYDPATEAYERITSNIGFTVQGTDISQLYNIKSKFVEVSTTSENKFGALTIPTWANGAKVFIGTMQGLAGASTSPAANGTPGANRGPFSAGTPGNQGPPGPGGHANSCPTGQAKRPKDGGVGGLGGAGGAAGAGASGGTGGTGGTGATGGVGGDGVRYSSPNITNLDTIRGSGISYILTANTASLSSSNFIYTANRGVTGNNATNPNAGTPGNDATGGNNGQDGQRGGQGQAGGNDCGSPGQAGQGPPGGQGAPGNNAIAGNNGTPGQNGVNGNKGANGNAIISGPSDLNAISLNTNSNSSNKIIVHFFID